MDGGWKLKRLSVFWYGRSLVSRGSGEASADQKQRRPTKQDALQVEGPTVVAPSGQLRFRTKFGTIIIRSNSASTNKNTCTEYVTSPPMTTCHVISEAILRI